MLDSERFGRNLKAIRKKKGITQAELGEMIGKVDKSTVYAWETGERLPRMNMLHRVADVTGYTCRQLLREDLLDYKIGLRLICEDCNKGAEDGTREYNYIYQTGCCGNCLVKRQEEGREW